MPQLDSLWVEEIKRLFFAQKRAPEIRLSFRNSSGQPSA